MSDDDWAKSPDWSIDPFPKVPPSLLNSSDIIRYAERDCLVQPFSRDLLNPATYTIRFLGTLYSWVQAGNTRCPSKQPIVEKSPMRLPANSITYLETKEVFRLPQYIAARFNLHIRHVHRGILLGTGPLVDPGFEGPLLIPLHNLTANDYDVTGGDNLLWVEFTKLTGHDYWNRARTKLADPPPRDLVVFPPAKQDLEAHQYFGKAEVATRGVVSAFKGELVSLQRSAKVNEESALAASKAAQDASTMVKRLTIGGGLALAVALLIGVGGLLFSAYELFQNNSEMASGIHERLDRIERERGLLPPECSTLSTPVVPTAADCRETGTANQPSNQDSGPESSNGADEDSQAEEDTAHTGSKPSAR